MFTLFIAGLLVIYFTRLVFNFLHNLKLARDTGLPYLLYPISEHSLLYVILFETRVVPNLVRKWLPTRLSDYIFSSVLKYRWTVKDRLHKRHGDVYMLVTPGTLSCNVADAAVVSQICMARRSFEKPAKQFEGLEIYGPSVISVDESKWAHHRRHTALAFNEKHNALVWQDGIRQTLEMMQNWTDEHGSADVTLPDSQEDMMKLSLNLICRTGYGVDLSFKRTIEKAAANTQALFKDSINPPPGYHFTFRQVMEYMSNHLATVFIANSLLPKWTPRALFPFLTDDFNAYEDLIRYFRALISDARSNNDPASNNLLNQMVRPRTRPTGTQPKSSLGFTETELLGNLYVFTVAGHETTATTSRFALALLALHQDVQDYVFKDIQEALHDESPDPAEWDYATVYPKLIATLCVMLETMRLYPPVVTIFKLTSQLDATFTYSNQTHHIPPNVTVNLNTNGLHYSPKYWGPDAESFHPQRWDKRNKHSFLAQNSGSEGLSAPGLEYATIHKPVRGAYIPFSDGFRACMGRKFAQVEFVIALALILRTYRISLAKVRDDEREEEVVARVQEVLGNSSSFLTLGMRDE
ncbi:hypothetical protein FE257_005367 [Aspergillus nanangensis]|uniref:Cytochrome P450 monooxygenase n=1 Tax=Aspergillus nanangensis TaxID=2582783 RepID=A0AAD4CQW6_ASPNN|nr:hypothetical protein FE257_005367 [Aspergillus nanangensis]